MLVLLKVLRHGKCRDFWATGEKYEAIGQLSQMDDTLSLIVVETNTLVK